MDHLIRRVVPCAQQSDWRRRSARARDICDLTGIESSHQKLFKSVWRIKQEDMRWPSLGFLKYSILNEQIQMILCVHFARYREVYIFQMVMVHARAHRIILHLGHKKRTIHYFFVNHISSAILDFSWFHYRVVDFSIIYLLMSPIILGKCSASRMECFLSCAIFDSCMIFLLQPKGRKLKKQKKIWINWEIVSTSQHRAMSNRTWWIIW